MKECTPVNNTRIGLEATIGQQQGMNNEQVQNRIRKHFEFGSKEFCTTPQQIRDLRRFKRPPPQKQDSSDLKSDRKTVVNSRENEGDQSPFILYKDHGERMRGFADDEFFLGIRTASALAQVWKQSRVHRFHT